MTGVGTILVVDDQAIVREPVAAALRAAGFVVDTASDGEEGLAMFRTRRPDAIVLDVVMPKLDGLSMLRELRATAEGHETPVVILTNKTDKATIVEAASLKIRKYILKSRFRLEELVTLLQELLPAQRAVPVTPKPAAPSASPRDRAAPASAEASAGDVCESTSAPESNPAPAPDSGTESAASANARSELRSIAPLLTRKEVLAKLSESSELKGFSPAVAEVLKLTSNERCSMESVSRAISRDHGLALKMLKLANSAVYTRGEPVESVQKAVLRIGLGQIRQAVLNIAVVDRFGDAAAGQYIEVGQFWEHAIATGIIAAELTYVRSEKEADSAFTTGLLHDVGKLLLLEALAEDYTAVLETADRLRIPIEQVEQHLIGMQHAEVMEHTLKLWNFSKQLVAPVVLHHLSAGNIRTTAPQQIPEVATVALANRLAHALQLGHTGNQIIYPTEELCELLDLEPSVMARLEAFAPEETVKVKFALLAMSNQQNWMPMIETNREAIGAPFVPVYVSSTPVFDAHRMFCAGLTARPVEEEPMRANVGVLHIRHARETEPLWKQFLAEEEQAGAANLPVIVITPTTKIALPAAKLKGRQSVQLTTPFAVKRFLEVAGSLLAPEDVAAAA